MLRGMGWSEGQVLLVMPCICYTQRLQIQVCRQSCAASGVRVSAAALSPQQCPGVMHSDAAAWPRVPELLSLYGLQGVGRRKVGPAKPFQYVQRPHRLGLGAEPAKAEVRCCSAFQSLRVSGFPCILNSSGVANAVCCYAARRPAYVRVAQRWRSLLDVPVKRYHLPHRIAAGGTSSPGRAGRRRRTRCSSTQRGGSATSCPWTTNW